MGDSYSTSKTYQTDKRQFVEGGSAIVGDRSSMTYPTSVSVFGSPGSDVGDISFVSYAPAPVDTGLSDQLSSIMSMVAAPRAPIIIQPSAPAAPQAPIIIQPSVIQPSAPAIPVAPAIPKIPSVPTAPAKAAGPNYLLWGGLALGAFLIWRM